MVFEPPYANTDGDVPEGVDKGMISRFIYRDMTKEDPDKLADFCRQCQFSECS
jgi:hypothetical protein